MQQPDNRISPIRLIKTFIFIFIAILFFLMAVAAVHYYTNYQAERVSKESKELLNVELARRMIVSDLTAVITDLRFLAHHLQHQGFDKQDSEKRKNRIKALMQTFSSKKGLYDQIRFLNEKGWEEIRVNYRDGHPESVADEDLQDKSKRYYFVEAHGLKPGDIYISPLDLNVEGGKIEQPIKPMMRFATPVFNKSGERKGLVVLNYFGSRLLRNFTLSAANIGDHIHLVNGEGYWLSHPRQIEEWGFMFAGGKTIADYHPQAWGRLSQQTAGQFLDPSGLVTFSTVSPGEVNRFVTNQSSDAAQVPAIETDPAHQWKIISILPLSEIAPTPGSFVRQNISLYGALTLLLALIAFLLARSHLKHRWAEDQNLYERRFRHTLEKIGLAAITVNRAGKITFCNDYFLDLCGWSRNEVVGKKWIDIFIPEEQQKTMQGMIQLLDQPDNFPDKYESEVVTRNGERKTISWNNTLTFGTEGKVLTVTGIGEDITEKRRNEEQVRKLSQAVEQSPSIVMITNRRGEIEYVNPKFTEVSGYLPVEVLGKNPNILKSGETTTDEYGDLWQSILHGKDWRGEFHNRRKSGELYWESASISALRDSKGEITHFVAVKEDINEKKKLEQTVEQRNRELAKAQALAAMGKMASMIAHDLRNPLSSVKMGLQIIGKQHQGLSREADELCHIGMQQIRYMEEILSDMLTFSRPEAVKIEWLSADKLLETTISMVQQKLDGYGVSVSMEHQPGLPSFPGDVSKLRQVFTNLIINAAQATEANDADDRKVDIKISLHMGFDGTALRFNICDNGIGLKDTDVENMFEAFVTTKTKGTGLGLAIVQQIVDQHQGSVTLKPGETKGACAEVILPTVRSEPAA